MKLDGLGNPLDPNEQYYVQDTRQTVGNCILWWARDRAGYTCELGKAGQYTGVECDAMRETDVPWPVELVEHNTVTHVRMEPLRRARDEAAKQRSDDKVYGHFNPPTGYEPCTREWGHDGPCAHPRSKK